MLKAFIVDDEFQSRSFLGNLLAQNFPEIALSGQAASVKEGIEGIKKYNPDIVFLDIQMNGETGFDLLNALANINFALVITSAFDRFAVKAFRFNAIDYLLKPIMADELSEAVNKIKQKSLQAQQVSKKQVEQLYQDMKNPQKAHDKISVPTADGFIFLSISDIVYCRANSNYTEFHLSGGKCVLSSYTLKQYDEILTTQSFFRAHRSYLVNLAHVNMYKRGDGGVVQMSNGHEIELARAHKEAFLNRLNIRA